MRWSTFLRSLPVELRAELPARLRTFHWRAYSSQAQAWFGNPSLHYEVWVRARLRVVEVGLHFEADELTNARLLAAFRARAKEVKRALGADARIEDWDKGWSRVWEPISLTLPDGEIERRVHERVRDYMSGLEPMLREELPSEVRWVLPAPKRATSSRTSR